MLLGITIRPASAPSNYLAPNNCPEEIIGPEPVGGSRGLESAKAPEDQPITPPAPPLQRDPLPEGALACIGSPRLEHADGNGLAVAPDARWVVSWSTTQVCLWDATTGERLHRWVPEPGSRCLGCAVVDGGRRVRIAETGIPEAGWDAWARDCDVATGMEVRRTWLERQAEQPLHVVLSGDGNWAACWEHGAAALHLWDMFSGTKQSAIAGPPSSFHGVVFAPDSKHLAIFDLDPADNNQQRVIRFCETGTGRLLGRYQGTMPRQASAAFAPDARALAVSGLALVEVPSGRVICRLDSDALLRPALAFSADGSRLVVGGNARLLRTWAVATGEELRPYRFQGVPEDESRARRAYGLRPIQAVSFAGNGQVLAALDAVGRIRLWEPAVSQELSPFRGHQGPVAAMALSPDGRLLATGVTESRLIHLWDLTSGRALAQLDVPTTNGPLALAFARDGRTLLYATDHAAWYRRWELPPLDRPVRHAVDTKNPSPCFLAFTAADGLHLRSSPKERYPLALADIDPGPCLVRLPDGEFVTASATPDGRSLLSKDKVWDPARAAEWRRFLFVSNPDDYSFQREPQALALSPDGRTLATYRVKPSLGIDLWELGTAQQRQTDVAELMGWSMGRRGELRYESQDLQDKRWLIPPILVFTHDGRLLISGDGDGVLRVWDLASRKKVHEFRGHNRYVSFLALTRDDHRLLSGGDDGLVFVWDMTQVQQKLACPSPPPTNETLERCWATLANKVSDQAYEAGWYLALNPQEAVAFLEQRWRPPPGKDSHRVALLIANLDSRDFLARQKATDELDRLDELVEADLRNALAAKPGLETAQRLEALLVRIEQRKQPAQGERLQAMRTLEVLEWIGTPEACVLLEHLAEAEGERGSSTLAGEARAALRRLHRLRPDSR